MGLYDKVSDAEVKNSGNSDFMSSGEYYVRIDECRFTTMDTGARFAKMEGTIIKVLQEAGTIELPDGTIHQFPKQKEGAQICVMETGNLDPKDVFAFIREYSSLLVGVDANSDVDEDGKDIDWNDTCEKCFGTLEEVGVQALAGCVLHFNNRGVLTKAKKNPFVKVNMMRNVEIDVVAAADVQERFLKDTPYSKEAREAAAALAAEVQ